ncbi:MAG: arsenate reductase ArsC [Betaproteobacteria bacterium]|nr:arsenate reductase ArsC [Betaproteobacteria bacterium]
MCLITGEPGIDTNPRVAAGAFEALRLAGLPTEGLYPKDLDTLLEQDFELVVPVCDNAREACTCPSTPPGEPLDSILRVRDDIRARLVPAVRDALGSRTASEPSA